MGRDSRVGRERLGDPGAGAGAGERPRERWKPDHCREEASEHKEEGRRGSWDDKRLLDSI